MIKRKSKILDILLNQVKLEMENELEKMDLIRDYQTNYSVDVK
jgi:hypothetical protein